MRIVKLKQLLCALAALWLLCGPDASAEAPSPTVTPGPTRAIADAAFAVPEPPGWFYVLDQADALDESTERGIFFLDQAAYDRYGVQLVVVTVDSTGGADIGDYAYTLYNRWGIGTMRHGSGLLLLMAVNNGNYCVAEGPNRELSYRFSEAIEALDARFEAGDYDGFAEAFLTRYIGEMIRLSDEAPRMKDYATYDAYSEALSQARRDVERQARLARTTWESARGASWAALRAEGGGGAAFRDVTERRAVLDALRAEASAREAEAEDGDEPDFRQSILMILALLGIIALLVFDSRHGWNITFFLLRCVLDALLTGAGRDDHDSGGRSSGGGGRFTGGGAGRGR